MGKLLLFVTALSALLAAPLPARAGEGPGKSAIVIVVENNPSGRHADGLRGLFGRALEKVGQPAYAAALEKEASRKWDRVVVLQDETARFASFAATLVALDREGFTIDVVLDVHGSSSVTNLDNSTSSGPDRLYFTGAPATPDMVAALGKAHPLRLNAVYMVSCWGSRFNDAWLRAGARAANGAIELNYYVLVSPLVFVAAFGAGLDLASAAEKAFQAEAALLDRDSIDRALAPIYGKSGAEKIHGKESSKRVQTGPAIHAACVKSAARGTVREPSLY